MNITQKIVLLDEMDENFPVVCIGKRAHEKGPNVCARFEQYRVDMQETLWQNGHRKIMMPVHEIHSYYLQAIETAAKVRFPGICLYPAIISNALDYQDQLARAIDQYVRGESCTAVVLEGVEVAQIILGICGEMHISVPEQLSILSVEPRQGTGWLCCPQNSAYYVPAQSMGSSAAELQLDIITSSRIFHFGTLSMTHEKVRKAACKAIDAAKHGGAVRSMPEQAEVKGLLY